MKKRKRKTKKNRRKMDNRPKENKQQDIDKGETVSDQPITLSVIAEQLKNANKKVQLIYGFNGMGKTRLSREFGKLLVPELNDGLEGDEAELSRKHFLYYSAFTEDLFYWSNISEYASTPKLKIQPNSFTDWILKTQGQDRNIVTNFQRYSNSKINPSFNAAYEYTGKDNKKIKVPGFSEVTFRLYDGSILTEEGGPLVTEVGDPIVTEEYENIKISKGEESNFIWSIFQALLEQVISILKTQADERETDQFVDLQYIFIDDPVSSLDDNHLIELAVNVAGLIKTADYFEGNGLRFIITTHNPLFYNILFNELGRDDKEYGYKSKHFAKYRLEKKNDGSFVLESQTDDSPFSYHLFLLSELEKAVEADQTRKYHFNFLRNILEKTSTFLGYKHWTDLLPKTADGKNDPYANRILNLSSHSKHAGDEVVELTDDDKRVLRFLVNNVSENNRNWQKEMQHD